MSAGRRAAAVVVALTIAANVGTLWVLFTTDFLGRHRVPGITDGDVVILDVFVCELVAVSVSYVSVGFLLAGRPAAGLRARPPRPPARAEGSGATTCSPAWSRRTCLDRSR